MKLRIAIQKSGRLNEDSIKILKEAGIEFNNGLNKLKAEAVNFPLEVFFLRDDDIPQYIEDGVADIGIVGENVVIEKNKEVKIVDRLGFGKCPQTRCKRSCFAAKLSDFDCQRRCQCLGLR